MGRIKTAVACCCLFVTMRASAQGNKQKAEALQQSVNKYLYESNSGLYLETSDREKNHNPHTYLWGLCGLIQAANEMEALHPGRPYMQPVITALSRYYSAAPPAPGYACYIVADKSDDRYYDDNQWIGIACLDAYARTGKKWFLEKGEEICRFMMTGYDTVSGGGLYWKEGDKTTKNTCSNGPGILLALDLYNATRKKSYLDTARLLYNWVNKYLRGPDGVYWDAIKPAENNRIDSAAYPHNTGAMLEANVKLYLITKNERYLKEAQNIAAGSYYRFYRNGRFHSSYWFNAVLLRGYEALYKVDKNRKYINAMQVYANNIWMHERDSATNLLGTRPEKELLEQAGMMEIYARLAGI